jgi:hypothetical protein
MGSAGDEVCASLQPIGAGVNLEARSILPRFISRRLVSFKDTTFRFEATFSTASWEPA